MVATTTNGTRSRAAKKTAELAVPESDLSVPTVEISRIGTAEILVPIRGTSPYISHKFSEKAKRQMLDAMQGRKTPKQPKDPQAEYESSMYRFTDGGYGIPVLAFKAATVGAARFYGKDVKMTELRQFIFMKGDLGEDHIPLVRLDATPEQREDVVRVGTGTDLRYRAEFWPWTTTLRVIYVKSALTENSVLSLIDAGGMGVGVGEWRVEKRGENGCYEVDPDRAVERVQQ